jgi:hypothetical protein
MILKIDLMMFYSKGDERRFFEGLSEVAAIKSVRGVGPGLEIQVSIRELNKDALLDLIALLRRYGISLAPLAPLAENKRFSWLQNERFNWHKNMFSGTQ